MKTVEELLNQPFKDFIKNVAKENKHISFIARSSCNIENKTVKQIFKELYTHYINILLSKRLRVEGQESFVQAFKNLSQVLVNKAVAINSTTTFDTLTFKHSKKCIIELKVLNEYFNLRDYFKPDNKVIVQEEESSTNFILDIDSIKKDVDDPFKIHLSSSCRTRLINLSSEILLKYPKDLSLLSANDFDFYLEMKLISQKLSARSRNIACTLTKGHLKKLLLRKTCYYTGVSLNSDNFSIDRLDSSEGYTNKNTVACTIEANALKNELFECTSKYFPTSFLEKMIRLRKEGKIK